jgi:hypothetical protein
MAIDGCALNTISASPPLTIVETSRLRDLKAKARHRLAPDSGKARAAFVAGKVKSFAKRTDVSEQTASEIIARQCDGLLLPEIELPFDDADFAGCTVSDVLADPQRFEGATLADPLEGVEYGVCKARIMLHSDGSPWIHSFAHGRTTYELKHSRSTTLAAIKQANNDEVVKTFIRLALAADEIEELRNEVAERTGLNKRTISDILKATQNARAADGRQRDFERSIAERTDPRPAIDAPVKTHRGCQSWVH